MLTTPRRIMAGLALQYAIMPALALALGRLLSLHPSYVIGWVFFMPSACERRAMCGGSRGRRSGVHSLFCPWLPMNHPRPLLLRVA